MCFSSARLLSSVISILVYRCPGGTLLLRVVAGGRTFLPLLQQDMTKTKQSRMFSSRHILSLQHYLSIQG